MTTTGILPNWSETYSTASSSSLVSESGIQIPTTAPQDVSEPVQDTSSDAPLEQSTQNIAVMTTTTTSMTSTLTSTLKRKHATLGLSNNSTKKLNEPPEICSECSIIFPTGLDLKKHIDLAHQVYFTIWQISRQKLFIIVTNYLNVLLAIGHRKPFVQVFQMTTLCLQSRNGSFIF